MVSLIDQMLGCHNMFHKNFKRPHPALDKDHGVPPD
jgi:hypothetical protein